MTGLLVVAVLVAAGCGGGEGEADFKAQMLQRLEQDSLGASMTDEQRTCMVEGMAADRKLADVFLKSSISPEMMLEPDGARHMEVLAPFQDLLASCVPNMLADVWSQALGFSVSGDDVECVNEGLQGLPGFASGSGIEALTSPSETSELNLYMEVWWNCMSQTFIGIWVEEGFDVQISEDDFNCLNARLVDHPDIDLIAEMQLGFEESSDDVKAFWDPEEFSDEALLAYLEVAYECMPIPIAEKIVDAAYLDVGIHLSTNEIKCLVDGSVSDPDIDFPATFFTTADELTPEALTALLRNDVNCLPNKSADWLIQSIGLEFQLSDDDAECLVDSYLANVDRLRAFVLYDAGVGDLDLADWDFFDEALLGCEVANVAPS